jgi:hypothetical protein
MQVAALGRDGLHDGAAQPYIAHDGRESATTGVTRWNGLQTRDDRSHALDFSVARRLQRYESSNFAIS